MTSPYLASDLRKDEGLRLHAYPDPLSGREPWTCGYGHTGADVGPDTVWTLSQAEDALAADIGRAARLCDAHLPWWRKLNDPRADVICELMFNMGWLSADGRHGLGTFVHTLQSIEAGDYEGGANGLLKSAWAGEVHGRATRLAEQMRTGVHVGADDLAIPPAPVAPPVVAQPLPPVPAPPEPVVVQTPPVTPVAGPIVHPLPADDVPLMLAMWAGLGAFLVGCVVWLVTLFRRPKAKAVSIIPVVQTVPEKEIPMSIVTKFWSQLFGPNAPGFNVAVATAAKSIDNLIAGNPAAQSVAAAALSDVKQGVSTAISLAQTDIAPYLGTAVSAIETAVDAMLVAGLAKVGPVGVTAAPAATKFANSGMSQAFQVLHSVLTNLETQGQAWAVTPSVVDGATAPGATVASAPLATG